MVDRKSMGWRILRFATAVFLGALAYALLVIPRATLGRPSVSGTLGLALFFLLPILLFRKFSEGFNSVVLVGIVSGVALVDLPIRLPHFADTLVSFPDALLCVTGSTAGFLFSRLKTVRRVLVVAVISLAAFWLFAGNSFWLHRLNYGTFTGHVTPYPVPDFELTDFHGNQLSRQTLSEKIVLLDFWYTRCGLCFEKFPQLDTVYEGHKDDKAFAVLSVNVPIAEDARGQAFAMISDLGYRFPVLLGSEGIADNFGIVVYPTTFVLVGGKVVYKGDIEGAKRLLDQFQSSTR